MDGFSQRVVSRQIDLDLLNFWHRWPLPRGRLCLAYAGPPLSFSPMKFGGQCLWHQQTKSGSANSPGDSMGWMSGCGKTKQIKNGLRKMPRIPDLSGVAWAIYASEVIKIIEFAQVCKTC